SHAGPGEARGRCGGWPAGGWVEVRRASAGPGQSIACEIPFGERINQARGRGRGQETTPQRWSARAVAWLGDHGEALRRQRWRPPGSAGPKVQFGRRRVLLPWISGLATAAHAVWRAVRAVPQVLPLRG